MSLVFKDWQASGDAAIIKPAALNSSLAEVGKQGMRLEAVKVLQLSENTAILLARAIPLKTDKASKDALAAYWFKRDGERWMLDARQDVMDWLASAYEIKSMKRLELALDSQAVLIEYDRPGFREHNLSGRLYLLRQQTLRSLLPDNQDFMLEKNAYNSSDCLDRIKSAPGKPVRIELNDRDGVTGNCLAIEASLQIKPGKGSFPDIAINTRAKTIEYRKVREFENPDDMQSYTVFDVIADSLRASELYRYNASKQQYQLLSGKKLLPAWYQQYEDQK